MAGEPNISNFSSAIPWVCDTILAVFILLSREPGSLFDEPFHGSRTMQTVSRARMDQVPTIERYSDRDQPGVKFRLFWAGPGRPAREPRHRSWGICESGTKSPEDRHGLVEDEGRRQHLYILCSSIFDSFRDHEKYFRAETSSGQ